MEETAHYQSLSETLTAYAARVTGASSKSQAERSTSRFRSGTA